MLFSAAACGETAAVTIAAAARAQTSANDKNTVVYAEEQNSTGNVKQAMSANPNAVGYVSISAVDASVSAIKIDGQDRI